MSVEELICGDAPQFILLVNAMAFIYVGMNLLKETEALESGIIFKKSARKYSYVCIAIPFFIALLVLLRLWILDSDWLRDIMYVAGILNNNVINFKPYDKVILAMVFLNYLMMGIVALTIAVMYRKYKQEPFPPSPAPQITAEGGNPQ